MSIEVIGLKSPHLPTVKALGKANAATLGFLPEGAFNDYAAKRTIIGAIDSTGKCVGYLLYRATGNQVTIAHLCVDKTTRQQGIAAELIKYLKEISKDFSSITLKCRRDYEAAKVWSRFGFIPLKDIPGRGRKASFLTYWKYDYGHPNMFTSVATEDLRTKLCVVMDANVFFDLCDPSRPGYEESSALLADWLPENLELCLTDEIYNDLNSSEDADQRKCGRENAKNFTRLQCKNQELEQATESLRSLFPERMSDRDETDLRQIGRAIASDAQFFITRDEPLLDKAEKIYTQFGVTVVRPSDFIIRLDELRRESEYHPARLAGTLSEIKRVQSKDISLLVSPFSSSAHGETHSLFNNKLRPFLSDPSRYYCEVAFDMENDPLALIVYDRGQEGELTIPLFRVARHQLAPTVARHLVTRALLLSSREKRHLTRIIDLHLSDPASFALSENAFIFASDEWVKINLATAKTASDLSKDLCAIDLGNVAVKVLRNELAEILSSNNVTSSVQTMVEVERLLFPAKIIDAEIPTFIVPIQPKWAKDLFDEGLANQVLWGAKVDLALNHESVYYRSRLNSGGLTAPGRILWYVSRNTKYPGSQCVRACSRLDEIIIGTPKELFRQFKRLGIYEWRNVFELAGRDIGQKIMALRFSDTELFTTPIHWNELQIVLNQHDYKSQIMSPLRVAPDVFSQLYILGTQTKPKESAHV